MSRPTSLLDIAVGLLLVSAVGVAGAAALEPNQSSAPADDMPRPVLVIRDFKETLDGACTSRSGVTLSVGRDDAFPTEPVLVVEYPVPTNDPAGRDVQCAAQRRDWTAGSAIAFQIKPARALRLSVSFMDRNRVAYTTWTELKGGVWQLVRIPFQEMRPNPYFQPPGAKTGAPIDVSAVEALAFAPQDQTGGRLSIRSFVVTN